VDRERGTPAPAPVAWDADFPASVGFARQSHEVYTDPRLGMRVGYATACDTHASVFEYPIQLAESTEIALRVGWARQMQSAMIDAVKLATLGSYRSFRWNSWAPALGTSETRGPQFVLAGFSHSRRPVSRAWGEDVTFHEWIALAPVGPRWLKIRYTYEACLAAFERPRFTRFLGLAWQAFDRIQKWAEIPPSTSSETPHDDVGLASFHGWDVTVFCNVVTGTVDPTRLPQGKPRWYEARLF